MFCGRRPGLLLATMKALDNLGLNVQQAVISCFNMFALNVFRAEVRILISSYTFSLNSLRFFTRVYLLLSVPGSCGQGQLNGVIDLGAKNN
ncbi:hypothetical protein Bca4012_049020 [Brassica carinata]